jgi:hypothetical protein
VVSKPKHSVLGVLKNAPLAPNKRVLKELGRFELFIKKFPKINC